MALRWFCVFSFQEKTLSVIHEKRKVTALSTLKTYHEAVYLKTILPNSLAKPVKSAATEQTLKLLNKVQNYSVGPITNSQTVAYMGLTEL